MENKLRDSEIVRDWMQHQIKELAIISDDYLREKAIEKITQTAMFRLAHIWLGDLPIK